MSTGMKYMWNNELMLKEKRFQKEGVTVFIGQARKASNVIFEQRPVKVMVQAVWISEEIVFQAEGRTIARALILEACLVQTRKSKEATVAEVE